MSEGRGARDALEADGVGGVGDAVEITPARAGRKLEVGHAAGTRPEKNALLAGREGGQIQCRRCGRHSAQPEEQIDAERLGPEPDCFCPLAGWLRRLELLVDLIRNRLAALIDPCGSITRKLREAPFPSPFNHSPPR